MMTKAAITSFIAILAACASLAMSARVTMAASLTITPSSIPGNYTGTVTLDITGLTTGQTVLVETFLDINGNGAIDGSDMLVQSFQVTDGQALSIGGVRNTNVPGDEDGVTDQKIRAVLNFPLLAEANKGVAKYVYRASPATSGFTPVTAGFTIIQPPQYNQKVVGKVTSGGSAVPYAFTFLTDPSMNGGPIVVALADASGNFTLNTAPGSYAVAAFKAGYVSDFSALPVVTVAANATVTQNLSLAAADRTISGQLKDLDSSAGIPGVQTTAESESRLFALVFSDASGNFVIPVSSASTQWGVYPSEKSLALLGYLPLEDDYRVDVGNASGVSIQLPKATALIYGTLKDNQGRALAGVDLYVDEDQYEGYGLTDSSGNYVAGVTAGSWWISPDSDELAARGYIGQGAQVTVTDGQAVLHDLEAKPFTAHLSGRATDDGGSPVGNAYMEACPGQGGNCIGSQTDANGNFSIGVVGGTWRLQLSSDDAQQRGLVRLSVPYSVQDGIDIPGIQYVARRATAYITGWVKDVTNAPLAGVGVDAYINVGGSTSYDSWQRTDSSGNFSLGVFNGTWWVNLSCDDVQTRGYICPNGQSVTIAGNNGTAYFTVQLPGALQITTTSLDSATQGQWYGFQLNATGGVGSYNWDLAPDSPQLPPWLNLSSSGYLSGTPTTGGTFNFTVRVTDSASHTAVQGLSLFVTSQPLQITTYGLPSGQVGVFYNTQLEASGGQPPYTWSLTPGSGPLPPGLALSGNTISGTPSTYGNSSLFIRVTDSANNFVDRNFSIFISPAPLQWITAALPHGRVDSVYSTQLQATGGVPPYYWALAPGSLPLPPGLTFGTTPTPGPTPAASTNGAISGTPTTEGTFSFIVRVMDSYGQSVDRPFSLLIKPPRQGPCEGDCGGDGQVTVDELLTMVNIALGNAEVSGCQAGDRDGGGQITVDEILTAVNNALNGC